ncbi:hypothetical protein BDV98DRAFT_507147 [Pterulicium gracile]|uniref:Uncharacterized protein n=1 Tax=Pterulicium gracile TaxID=1884261 RepID=A0A5C3QJC7_9AGAR|nr:hypothetical protein BDV98DRAFT_507147 [Pterula gracilis]
MAAIANATRIWEADVRWDLYSQCGVWDGKGVNIWECIRAHTSAIPGSQPPNTNYWRYIGRR